MAGSAWNEQQYSAFAAGGASGTFNEVMLKFFGGTALPGAGNSLNEKAYAYAQSQILNPAYLYEANIVGWYDAYRPESLTKNSSNAVTRWNDRAQTNNNNMTGSSGTSTYSASQSKFGNKPCVKFDNSVLTLADNTSMAISAFSIFVVYSRDSAASGATTRNIISKWSGGGQNEFLIDLLTSKKPRLSISTTGSNQVSVTAANAPTDDVPHLLEAHYSSGSTEFFVDGVSQGSASGTILATGTSTWAIGGATASEAIYIGSVLWVNSMLTGSNLTNTRNYIKRKWGISY